MKPSEKDTNAATTLDKAFRGGEHAPELQTERHEYKRWYARLLTTLVLTAGGEEIIWGQMQRRESNNEAIFTVLTARAVVVAHARSTDLDDPQVEVRAIGRSTLTELEVHASIEIDQEGSSSLGWPGDMQIAATHYAPEKLLVVYVASKKASDGDTEAPVLRLMAELHKDLNA